MTDSRVLGSQGSQAAQQCIGTAFEVNRHKGRCARTFPHSGFRLPEEFRVVASEIRCAAYDAYGRHLAEPELVSIGGAA